MDVWLITDDNEGDVGAPASHIVKEDLVIDSIRSVKDLTTYYAHDKSEDWNATFQNNLDGYKISNIEDRELVDGLKLEVLQQDEEAMAFSVETDSEQLVFLQDCWPVDDEVRDALDSRELILQSRMDADVDVKISLFKERNAKILYMDCPAEYNNDQKLIQENELGNLMQIYDYSSSPNVITIRE